MNRLPTNRTLLPGIHRPKDYLHKLQMRSNGYHTQKSREVSWGKELVVARSPREQQVTVSGGHIQIRNPISREQKEITFDYALCPLSCDMDA